MKTTPEHDELLNEVLTGGNVTELRTKSLDDTLTAVRQHRRLRHALRCASPVAAIGILMAIFWYRHSQFPQPVAVQPAAAAMAAPTVPGTSIRLVSDEELLAMFPDRPVALVGPPENRQFVFLDEKRASQAHDPRQVRAHSL